MAQSSAKSYLVEYLVWKALFDIEYAYQDVEDFDKIEEMENNILEELHEDVLVTIINRRGINYFVPKSLAWSEDILAKYDDARFKHFMRCTKEQFLHLASLIEKSAEFNQSHSCEQFNIHFQLAVALYRLGSSGEGATIRKIASHFGIGDGGTVQKITDRIFRAFIKMKEQFIYWPDASERKAIVEETLHELPECIGYVDGTEFKLAEVPAMDSVSYFSRKHIYSIKAQLTCDHKLRIRHMIIGHPGSVHDARMFSKSFLASNPSNYFSGNQWLAADSAYSLSNTVITPYRSNSNAMTAIKRKQFNLRHSKYRVRVENCIGRLKGRFGSLKELRHRLLNEDGKKLCIQWILGAGIIHNILLSDTDNEYEAENVEHCEETIRENETVAADNRFELKRQAIYRTMFE